MILCHVSLYRAEAPRRLSIEVYLFLSHNEYINLPQLSDIFFLPATPRYYYGGPGVAVMEALALGKPVVSPTLIHIDSQDAKELGGSNEIYKWRRGPQRIH